MVRAATTGAIDYSRADPAEKFWRIKHRLVLQELERADDQKLIECTHQHWCAYLSHGSLKEGGFDTAKKAAIRSLRGLERIIFPWQPDPETETENSTIDGATQNLIKYYRQNVAQKNEQPGG
jgi:hypothetical protein